MNTTQSLILIFLLIIPLSCHTIDSNRASTSAFEHGSHETEIRSSDPLHSLSWLAGHWAKTTDTLTQEEYWMPPKGGMMLGLHRDAPTQGNAFFEYLRIENTPEGIIYQASPQGRSPTPFKLMETGDRSAMFENPKHDFPQRIRYWIDDEGILHARIEGKIKGVEKSSEWTYSKVALD